MGTATLTCALYSPPLHTTSGVLLGQITCWLPPTKRELGRCRPLPRGPLCPTEAGVAWDEDGGNTDDDRADHPAPGLSPRAPGSIFAVILGVILLLDERLLASSYTRLFPREWRSREVCTVESVGMKIREFWEKHLNFDK